MLETLYAGFGMYLGMNTNWWLAIPGILILGIGVALWYKFNTK